MRNSLTLLTALLLAPQTHLLAAESDVRPDEIQFRRQAAIRMVFDAGQNIPLSSLRPAKVIDLDLMHPELLPDSGVKWELKNGGLSGSSPEADGSSLRWAGAFNPFATYDLVVNSAQGGGSTGMTFLHSSTGDSLTASLQFKDGKPESVIWNVLVGGKQVTEEKWPVPAGTAMKDLTLRAQMSAVGVNVFLESAGRSDLIGCSDFAQHFDLRERKRIQQMDFAVRTDLTSGPIQILSPPVNSRWIGRHGMISTAPASGPMSFLSPKATPHPTSR